MRATVWNPLSVACIVALWAAPAVAQQRISVESFPGDKRGAARAQIATAVCAQTECVPPSRISTRKKVDWRKVARERLTAIVSGSVTGKGAKQKLSLVVVDSNKQIVWRRVVKLTKGKLPPRTVGAVSQEIVNALSGATAPPPAEVPAAEAPPPPATPPDEGRPFFSDTATDAADAGTPAPPSETPATEPTTSADVADVTGETPPPAAEASPRTQPIIVAELGADILFREFGFQNLETPNLFGYRAAGIVMPSLHVEVYPIAPFSRSGWVQGIGITGDVAFAVGLRSSLDDGTVFPTRVMRYGFGVKWAIAPIAGSRFNFGPEIGYRAWDFEVLPGENGTIIPQLPALAYRGMDIALGAEVPLGSFGTISGRFAYLPLFSASQLLSSAFFPNGRGSGLNAELSLGFFLGAPWIELRLTGLFTQFNLSFTDVQPTDTYRATSSSDRYLGGKVGLRFRW